MPSGSMRIPIVLPTGAVEVLSALDGYFVMHALKYRRYDRAFKLSFPRFADFNVLGTDDDVDKLVNLVIVEAVESRPAEFDF